MMNLFRQFSRKDKSYYITLFKLRLGGPKEKLKMGIFDAFKHRAGDYLFSVGAKRVGAAVAGFVVGKLASGSIAAILNQYGITVDPATLSTEINGAIIAGSVALHDWLRVKFPGLTWL